MLTPELLVQLVRVKACDKKGEPKLRSDRGYYYSLEVG